MTEEVEIKIEDEGESAERITTVEEMLQAFREKVKQDVGLRIAIEDFIHNHISPREN